MIAFVLAALTVAVALLIYEFRRVQSTIESFRGSMQQVDKLLGAALDLHHRNETRILRLEEWRKRVEAK